ncbi:hypothetical protein [Streptomyces sp. NPDC020141]|uniref:hypothetical protein n=1 Tax=Streptomyces sp. NPDC020141 TaxID=3365065 RepID=UPI0037B187AF
MSHSYTLHTYSGYTITVTPMGGVYDLHVRSAEGETAATVRMSAAELAVLRGDLRNALVAARSAGGAA